ncbi:YihY/virulence factor BrkB family protein [Pedobacter sp. SYP-B3415]|uniref:YihY/virulence factor BrkB family protein n=1 Tax=Pedobacter sp. SYP-B3415 TaxID=2496641 RepID=UPI001F106226|nr:YihY/virulence factor BrkB family protein [Pedobacter sp. SYP-B3415]
MQTHKEKSFRLILEEYLGNWNSYLRLKVVARVSALAADLITNSVAVICFSIFAVFAMITLAFFLGWTTNSYTTGFGLVTILLLITAGLIIWKSNKLENAIGGMAARRYFSKHHENRPDHDTQTTKQHTSNMKTNADTAKKKKITFKGIFEVFKSAFAGFGEHKVTKMSGSLAYYTVFSMAPLLVVIISLCGIFLGQEAAEGKIYAQLDGFMGKDTALQLQDIVRKASLGDKGTVAFIIGIVTLLIGSTTIFGDIQDSINTIWGLKPKPKRGWLKMLQNRFLSFSVIISLGFVLLVSLAVTAVLDGLSEALRARYEDVSVVVFYVLNQILTLVIISLIFGVIFKVLPDGIIKWRDVILGSVVTALLFMLGKFAISIYIGQSDVGSTYGAAGSLVIVLLWTYYSSIILYFGAEFTKAYAIAYGSEIHPAHYAVTTKEVEIETEGQSVQETEAQKK